MSSPVVSSSSNTNTTTATTTTTPTKSATDNIKNIDSILSKMSSGTKSLNTQSSNNNNNNQNHRNFLLESFDYNNKLSKSAKNTLNTNYFDTSSYRKSIDSQSLDHNNHHHPTSTSTSSTNSIKLKLNDQLNKINDSINNIHINRNSINTNNTNSSSSSSSNGSSNNKTSTEDVLINLKLKNLRNRPKRRSIENLMETFEEFNKANKFNRLPLVEESISTPTTNTTSATTISDQINSSLTKQQVKKIEIEKKSNFKDLMYKSLKSKTNNNDPIKILNNINNNNNNNNSSSNNNNNNNRPKSFYGYPNNFYIQKYLESSYKTIDIIDHLNEFNRNYDKLSKPISDEIDYLDSNSKDLEQNANTNKDEKKQKIDNIEEEIVVVVEDNNNNNNNKLENEVVINNKPVETSTSAYSSLWNDKTIVLNNDTDYNRASYHETIATTQPQPQPPPQPQQVSSNSYYFTVSEPVSEPTPTKLYNQLDQNQEITSNTNSIGASLANIKDDYILDIPKKKSFSDEFYRAKSSLSHHHHNSIRSINSQLSKETIENDSSIMSDYVSSSYAVSASATVPSTPNINTNTNLIFEKPKGNSLFLI